MRRIPFSKRALAPLLFPFIFGLSGCKSRTFDEDLPVTPRSSLADLPHWKRPTDVQVTLLDRAKTALLNHNPEEAIDQLTQLRATTTISLELRDGTLLYAELLEQRDRRTEAIRTLTDFAMSIPPDGDILYSLGRMELRAGNRVNAEAALRDATRAAPELLRSWLALAELLQESGRDDEANEIMIHYERELYRLGATIERSATQEARIAAIHQFRVALPDPRISRILANALRNDALDVQSAALMALDRVGTHNALPALDAYIAATPHSELQQRAASVRANVAARGR